MSENEQTRRWIDEAVQMRDERDEALALVARLRVSLESIRQRAVEHDESNSAYLGCAGTGGIVYVAEEALEFTPAAAYAELTALKEVAAAAEGYLETPPYEGRNLTPLVDALTRLDAVEGRGE